MDGFPNGYNLFQLNQEQVNKLDICKTPSEIEAVI